MGTPMCDSAASLNDAGLESPHAGPGTGPASELDLQVLARLDRIATALEDLVAESRRIVNHVAPASGDIVGTPHVAQRLGCSVVWVAEMARSGQIPKNCIVPGTGNGKPWKFYVGRIEEWLNKR